MSLSSLIHRVSSGIKLPDRRPLHEWAEEFIQLPGGGFTMSGNFKVGKSRYLIPVWQRLTDDSTRRVVLMKPTRGGGSMAADIWVPWILANAPGPIMWNHQGNQQAKEAAETRTWPILKACKAVAHLFPDDQYKVRNMSIVFNDGTPLWVQGPSLERLQGKGIRYQINSEVWLWDRGTLAQAEARCEDFSKITRNSKIFIESQPGEEGDDLHEAFQSGTRESWVVPCEKCSKLMALKFSGRRQDGTRFGIVWDDSKGDAHAAATVRFECEHCGHPHLDTVRNSQRWAMGGRYVAERPEVKGTASMRFSGIIVRDWAQMVLKFLNAQGAVRTGNIEPLKEFTQKDLTEPWCEKQTEPEPAVEIYTPSEEWPDETHRFMTVDRQADELHWVVIRAWNSRTMESRRLYFGKAHGENELRKLQLDWRIKDTFVFIDSGYQQEAVFELGVKYGWTCTKGVGKDTWQHPIFNTDGTPQRDDLGRAMAVPRPFSEYMKGDPNRRGLHPQRTHARYLIFSNLAMKNLLQRFRNGKLGRWLIPASAMTEASEEDYNRQMSSEFLRKTMRGWQWVQKGQQPNHLFDCEVLQCLAASILKIVKEVKNDNE